MKKGLFMLLLAFLISACQTSTKPPVTVPDKDFSGLTLNVLTSFDESDGNRSAYMQLVGEFENATGAIILEDSAKSDEKWKLEVIDNFNNDVVPDVLFFFKNVPEVYSKTVSIDTIRSEYPDYASNISSSVMADMKESDNVAYAIPVTGFWEGMFINQSLFAENNIEIPTTFDMLMSTIDSFNELDIIPIAASIKHEPHYLFEFLLYNRTGPSGHRRMVSSPNDGLFSRWEQGLSDFNLLYERGAFQSDIDITHQEALQLFQDKKAAMFVDGAWRVGSISDKDDCIVVPFPGTDMRKATDLLGGFSMGFYITQKAWDSNPDLAVAFVDAMSTKEAISLFGANGAASPLISPESSSRSNLTDSILKMSREATAFVPALQDKFKPGSRESILSDIRLITLGEKSPEQAILDFIRLEENDE